MGFYAYLWLREDGTPYYAGKGSGKRAFRSLGHGVINYPQNPSQIRIFLLPNEAAAFAFEEMLIRLFGRKDLGTGCLRNRTAGGDNPPPWPKGKSRAGQNKGNVGGWRLSADAHRRISIAAKVRWMQKPHRHSEESKQKMRHPKSLEAIRRMSEARKILWQDPAYRAKQHAGRIRHVNG